ncbi:MAG: hypothetical protein E7D91_05010 [Cutibacterium avidum]|uniref:hypothetical protein n=2 Tax=Cutibacterium TaxID=1912216 RepID=UPI00290494B8|nr:hypothetical protein [Cutibacterium avidum]
MLTLACQRQAEQLGRRRLGGREIGRDIHTCEEIPHMIAKIVMLRREVADLLSSLVLESSLLGKIVHYVSGGSQCLRQRLGIRRAHLHVLREDSREETSEFSCSNGFDTRCTRVEDIYPL